MEAGYQLLQKGQYKAGIQHLMMARLMADWTRWRFILEYLPAEGKELAYKQLRRDVYLVDRVDPAIRRGTGPARGTPDAGAQEPRGRG